MPWAGNLTEEKSLCAQRDLPRGDFFPVLRWKRYLEFPNNVIIYVIIRRRRTHKDIVHTVKYIFVISRRTYEGGSRTAHVLFF
jgi:hypothetical protein